MAADPSQQLSLVAGSEQQGQLFDLGGFAAKDRAAASARGTSPAPGAASLQRGLVGTSQPEQDRDTDLEAEGRSRPRGGAGSGAVVRRSSTDASNPLASNPLATEPLPAGDDRGGAGEPSSDPAGDDLPRWHHHSLVDPAGLTPMLRHYVELKANAPERVLLYRLGDFFECFFEDAIALSRLLELTLTGKEGGRGIGRVPMAGIPHHAAERYCAELVRRGLSVALCDQLESTPAKGALLRRDITRVLTPGTVIEEGLLAARRNNWLCAVVVEGARWGLAVADVSTGEFRVTERQDSGALHQELLQLDAAEVIWPNPERDAAGAQPSGAATAPPPWCPSSLRLTHWRRTPFEAPEARARLLRRFRLASLDGLGLGELPLALRAAGGLLAYLDSTRGQSEPEAQAAPTPGSATIAASSAVSRSKAIAAGGGGSTPAAPGEASPVPLDLPTVWFAGDQLVLDAQTRRNLELTRTQLGGQLQGSLLWALDRTATAPGGRCLRRWIEAPLVNREAILVRQDAVSELVEQRPLRLALRRLLRPMADLERLAGRAGAGSASARDLVALADGLERLPRLASLVRGAHSQPLRRLTQPEPKLAELAGELRHALLDTPPLSLSEGGLIHDGIDPLLDGLRNRLDEQDAWLAQQEAQERQLSGNPNLRLQYHRSFGYFLAVSRARAAAVPDHWIRRQTLANEERFVTPEIKAREGRILQLRARAAQREYELFCGLRQRTGAEAALIREAARRVAEVDALASLAEVAANGGYCRPELTDGRELLIEAGRHPVVEQLLVEEPFTANDLRLGGAPDPEAGADGAPDLLVLTGPNASGKSCYLRQSGLLLLMAQIGSWIPARSARLGLADRIFTRVGAVDDLASGQSTFMVEMAETANILHHASARSLVLLDEIGRGTATFDGLSIAWAVAEHLAGRAGVGIGARTIFATHYHELNELAALLPNVGNAQVLVEETGDALVFLHRVVSGGASRSYGIEAARLAGVPATVVRRARQVLGRIEANSHVAVGLEPNPAALPSGDPEPSAEPSVPAKDPSAATDPSATTDPAAAARNPSAAQPPAGRRAA
jgi:DNA mismatch repair protein MutS